MVSNVLNVFGPVRTCLDLLGHIRMHLDPLGSIRMRSEAFEIIFKSNKNFWSGKKCFVHVCSRLGGSGHFWMSKTTSAGTFASDTLIMTSVRPLGLPKMSPRRPKGVSSLRFEYLALGPASRTALGHAQETGLHKGGLEE